MCTDNFPENINTVPEKNPYPPHGRSSEISRAEEVLRSQNLRSKQNYEAKLEFHGGWGVQNQNPSVGEVWIFSGTAHWKFQGVGGGGGGGSQKAKIF